MRKLLILSLFCLCCNVFQLPAQEVLTAQDVLNSVLQQNFRISVARQTGEIAGNNNVIGEAGMLPTISATEQYQESIQNTQLSFFDGRSQSAEGARSELLAGSVLVNWTIFDGLSMFARREELALLEAQAGYNLRAEIENTTAEVLALYWRVVSEQDLLDVYRTSLKYSEQRLNLVQRQVELGGASDVELIQAQTARNEDSTLVIQQRYLIRSLQADINLLMNRDAEIPFRVGDSLLVNRDVNIEELKSQVRQTNTSLLQARNEVLINEQRTRQEQGAYSPQIAIFGQYDYSRSQNEVGVLSSNRNFGPVAGLSLTWNVFDGLRQRRLVANQRIATEIAKTQEEGLALQANRDLEVFYNDYQAAMEQVNLEESNLMQQERSLAIAQRRYELGSLNVFDFRDFQLSLAQAQNRLLTARYRAKLAEINLMLVTGAFAVN